MNSVSVIISCYNGALFLAEAIDSALSQTHPVEVVVVDDGSTDNTAEVCAQYPNVRYIYQHNQGVSVARNTGIHVTQGAFLIFLDCDDILMPNTAEIGVKTFLAGPDLGAIFGYYKPIDTDGNPMPVPEPPQATPSYVALLRREILVPPSCWMIRRTALDVVGEFTPSLRRAEDSDLWLRIARVFPIAATHQPGCLYRQHDGNISNNAAKMLKDCLRMLSLQEEFIQKSGNPDYQAAYKYGRASWIKTFGSVMPHQVAHAIKRGQWGTALEVLGLIFRYYPQGLTRYCSWLVKSVLFAMTVVFMTQSLVSSPLSSPKAGKKGIKYAVSQTQLWKQRVV